ncbi:F0F1 ATP synthase subunit epsilon [Labrys neptuniae]|uniref:ATP synthase epsilon chain n=1 Tax=Labrys neptuniae TaxID=376174 RepID=A0ABV3PWS8_9HYPH|nr:MULTISPECIES: F0F1 ATP synthase subunit epsilon [Labrys]MDT3377294.1 F0F1 ATP synthase subunit epsilon [Labrys neptuniae]MDZ5452830.1 F0F1 ATP synthase subunit epsilon [Labrys sp. ZIDIC5]
MASFQFELVTPEKLLFSGPVESVVVPGSEGDFEVLSQHAPVMSTIRPGIIVVKETAGGSSRHLFVRGGFADVNPQGLTILAEQAVPIEEMTPDKLSQEIAAAEAAVQAAVDDAAKALADLKLGQIKELQKALS